MFTCEQTLNFGMDGFRVWSRVAGLAIECKTVSGVGSIPRIRRLHAECHVKHPDVPDVFPASEFSPFSLSLLDDLSYSTSRYNCRFSMA